MPGCFMYTARPVFFFHTSCNCWSLGGWQKCRVQSRVLFLAGKQFTRGLITSQKIGKENMSSPLSFCEMGIFLVFFLPDVQSARGGRGSARSLYGELVAVSRPRRSWVATPLAPGPIERARPFSPLLQTPCAATNASRERRAQRAGRAIVALVSCRVSCLKRPGGEKSETGEYRSSFSFS